MKSDSHNAHNNAVGLPTNADVTFEPRDIRTRPIYFYFLGLAVAVVASYIVCLFVFRSLTKLAVDSDTPPPPVRRELGANYLPAPPEPRLQGTPVHQGDPQRDLREKIQQDTQANETLGWVDPNAGIAQIPVEDAMKIIAEKGLPGAPPAAPAETKK
jgi:hypothetical protein